MSLRWRRGARRLCCAVEEMEPAEVDVHGFSIGNFVHELMLIRSAAVADWWSCRRRGHGAAGVRGWAPEVIEGVPSPTLG